MERIGDSVRRAAPGTSLPELGALAEITRVWPAAVGDAIARAAWPARIARDGTLHVAAASSTWAFELAGLAPQIVARLEEHLGKDAPRTLRFVPGPVPEPPAALPPAIPARGPEPTAAERAEAAGIAAAIGDEELRSTVARAAAASLARRRSDRRF